MHMKPQSKIIIRSGSVGYLRHCFAAVAGAACLVFAQSLFGQPCSSGGAFCITEAIWGDGYNQKIGWGCGTGCDKKVYMSLTASTTEKITYKQEISHGSCGTDSMSGDLTYMSDPQDFEIYLDNWSVQNCNPTPRSVVMPGGSFYCVEHRTSMSWLEVPNGGGCYQIPDSCTDSPCGDDCHPNYSGCSRILGDVTITATDCAQMHEIISAIGSCGTYIDDLGLTSGHGSEYSTATVIQRAHDCAMYNLSVMDQALLFLPGSPSCDFGLASDKTSASVDVNKWRLHFFGGLAGQKYHVVMHWMKEENGISTPEDEDEGTATAPGQLDWYYPNEHGKLLLPVEADQCGRSYFKVMTRPPTITPL